MSRKWSIGHSHVHSENDGFLCYKTLAWRAKLVLCRCLLCFLLVAAEIKLPKMVVWTTRWIHNSKLFTRNYHVAINLEMKVCLHLPYKSAVIEFAHMLWLLSIHSLPNDNNWCATRIGLSFIISVHCKHYIGFGVCPTHLYVYVIDRAIWALVVVCAANSEWLAMPPNPCLEHRRRQWRHLTVSTCK